MKIFSRQFKILAAFFVIVSAISCGKTGGSNSTNPNGRYGLGTISINNHTNQKLSYSMMGTSWNDTYDVDSNDSSTYSISPTDVFASFYVYVDSQSQSQSQSRHHYDDGKNYNAKLIRTIDINTPTSYTVTCLDGGHTSCQVTNVRNAITLTNMAGSGVSGYMIDSAIFNSVYYIGATDTYHTDSYDHYATIRVTDSCTNLDQFGSCPSHGTLNNCVGGAHYDASQIKSIVINSLSSCSVTCLDGTNTTCKQD